MEELRERLMKAGMPEATQMEALKQLGRLERSTPRRFGSVDGSARTSTG